MTVVNPPPQLRIPREFLKDSETRAFFERQQTILFQLWNRTGGGSDGLAAHEALVNEHIDWTIDQGATNIDPNNVDVSSLEVEDEGSSLTVGATKFNFVGAGVTATEPIANEITVTIPGGGGGAWETAVADVTPTNTNTFDITWDETKYSAIRMEWDALETDTDGASLFLQVGSANGGTIYNTAGDYSHKSTDLTGTTWTFDASLGDIRLSSSWGNATGEGSYGRLEIVAANDSNNGGILNYEHVYKSISGSMTQLKGFVGLEGNITAAVDTVRFGLVAGGHSFDASGTVRVYGLLKTPGGGGGGVVSIDDLSDVDTTTDVPVLGDTLTFDGTNWVTDMTQLIKEVDDVGGTTFYIGEAQPGTTTATAAWRVKRIVFTGDDSETLFADGDSNFDNTWTGRAGFSYS